MSIDVARARARTRGCENVAHFNNAGAALPPDCVTDALIAHLKLEESIGGYEAAHRAAGGIAHAYDAVARLIGARADEIALVENATRAWDMAFYAIPFRPGDRILTAQSEYASNYIAFLQMARRAGVGVEAVPNDADGALSIAALEAMIDERVKLIAVTHVPTNGGLVNPAAAIGRVARGHGILYLLDACQSVGQMPIDVRAIGCDMLSATGRKFLRGPRGTGFLFVRREILGSLEPPFLDLHAADWTGPAEYKVRADARRFENWESYVAGRIGLGVAVDYALELGLEAIRERVVMLADLLRENLAGVGSIELRDLGRTKCGIVSFTHRRLSPERLKAELAKRSINVSVTGADSTLLDMRARGIESAVRASPHYYNTEEEIARFAGCLRALA